MGARLCGWWSGASAVNSFNSLRISRVITVGPANRGPLAGLFLVGGSTHPGGGLPMVTLSAKIVADRIGPA